MDHYKRLLINRIVQIWHTYTDACRGFELFLKSYYASVPNNNGRLPNEGVTNISRLNGSKWLFRPEIEIIAHNKNNGINFSILAQMSVCQIAGYWNDTREDIEQELGLNKKDLFEYPFFKEVVDFRNMVLHKDGKADDRIHEFRYFTWLKEGEFITFTEDQMEAFINDLWNELERLYKNLDC